MRPIIFYVGFLVVFGLLILNSIAPSLFPTYFIYVFIAAVAFIIFSQIDFEVISLFSKHLYVISLILLVLPLIIGQVTRGAIRWIPVGPLAFQPAEIVRPLLLVFFANYITAKGINFKRLLVGMILLAIPLGLIVIQPSLGVTVLSAIGFLGVVLASEINKKYIFFIFLVTLALVPIFWQVLVPYQKERIQTFLDPTKDPYGTGYNSLQSMISVGAGKVFGRGLGKGVQTQLAFLPEKHTDFIFASIAEELGIVGAGLLLVVIFLLLYKLVNIVENARSPTARAYVAGFFLTLLAQIVIHIGMNMGLLPITGIPLPFVSAGGSSLLASMIGLAIAIRSKKEVGA